MIIEMFTNTDFLTRLCGLTLILFLKICISGEPHVGIASLGKR